jgi:hypothetical protein
MSTAMTTSQPRGLALQTISEAMTFGKMLAGSSFVPKDFRGKPEDCVLAVQHGAELGLGPMQSVQSIAVINGRPSIWGDAAIALAKGSAVCEYISERIEGDGDSMTAICEAKRRTDPTATVSTFSVADAKKAGLWGKAGPWQQYPKRMLQLRARGFALRDAFPDILRGLVTAEEAQDYPKPEPENVRVYQPPKEPEAELEPATRSHPVADDAAMAKARAAIETASSDEQLRKFALAVHTRQDDGFYTSEQAAELLDMCDERKCYLEDREEVTA